MIFISYVHEGLIGYLCTMLVEACILLQIRSKIERVNVSEKNIFSVCFGKQGRGACSTRPTQKPKAQKRLYDAFKHVLMTIELSYTVSYKRWIFFGVECTCNIENHCLMKINANRRAARTQIVAVLFICITKFGTSQQPLWIESLFVIFPTMVDENGNFGRIFGICSSRTNGK